MKTLWLLSMAWLAGLSSLTDGALAQVGSEAVVRCRRIEGNAVLRQADQNPVAANQQGPEGTGVLPAGVNTRPDGVGSIAFGDLGFSMRLRSSINALLVTGSAEAAGVIPSHASSGSDGAAGLPGVSIADEPMPIESPINSAADRHTLFDISSQGGLAYRTRQHPGGMSLPIANDSPRVGSHALTITAFVGDPDSVGVLPFTTCHGELDGVGILPQSALSGSEGGGVIPFTRHPVLHPNCMHEAGSYACGVVLDTNGHGVAGVLMIVTHPVAGLVATTLTDAWGRFHLLVPVIPELELSLPGQAVAGIDIVAGEPLVIVVP